MFCFNIAKSAEVGTAAPVASIAIKWKRRLRSLIFHPGLFPLLPNAAVRNKIGKLPSDVCDSCWLFEFARSETRKSILQHCGGLAAVSRKLPAMNTTKIFR